MKKCFLFLSTIVPLLLMVIPLSGCKNTPRAIDNIATPVYSGPTISGEIEQGWKKTTITKMESMLSYKLPVPTYLPNDYKIMDAYYYQEPNSNPQVTDILLLISDQPVELVDNQYRCRLALEIGWNEAGLGLKMTWAEYIEAVHGRLEEKDSEYVLWWESYGAKNSLGSTLRLYTSLEFSKDELVRIAASTPANSSG